MDLPYSARVISVIEKGPGYWNYQQIGIFEGDTKIGEYLRNYSSFMQTFLPFAQNGQTYALYSSHYTATRVMRLPSCEDICGEDPSPGGFCPMYYHVPDESKGKIGFVAGCVWGDDSSVKIEFLDLSRIEEGVLIRDGRLGRLVLPTKVRLADAIDMSMYDEDEDSFRLRIASEVMFNLHSNRYEEI